jgi:hypothetical protein
MIAMSPLRQRISYLKVRLEPGGIRLYCENWKRSFSQLRKAEIKIFWDRDEWTKGLSLKLMPYH